ncbi:MAG: hypothetical protein ABIF10_02285 [Candidatus Woesearchaeota archaeon]
MGAKFIRLHRIFFQSLQRRASSTKGSQRIITSGQGYFWKAQDKTCCASNISFYAQQSACGTEFSGSTNCDGNLICPEDICVQEPVCGNIVIYPGEECELPDTSGDAYGYSGNQACHGKKLGARDTQAGSRLSDSASQGFKKEGETH